ncbi:MAG TPA: IS110 family transposase [Gemmatimonadales bacterium]|jgi:transposase
MWYSGIDQHKAFCLITTYGADGPRVKQARVASTALALEQYFAQFPGPHQAVVESTGGWYWLADTLVALGVELILAHATGVKAIAAAKVKTDEVDSDTLALLLRADLIPRAHMIAAAQRGPRDLMRTRLRLVEKVVSASNSIDRLLEKFNLDDVAQLTDPLYQLQAQCHAAQIHLLEEQIQTVERALYPYLLPTSDVQRLLWVPGLGKVNAFTIYTEIDGIARFASAGQFFSYCRLVPGAKNSAGQTRHRSGSKAGSRYLKLAFSHAQIRAVQYYPEIRAFFKAKARKKAIRIARTLVALELARIVYHVLSTGEEFNGRFKDRPVVGSGRSGHAGQAHPPN